MFSFKLKLALYFLVLSLLPLLAGFVGFSALEARNQTQVADARLEGGLRGALAAYEAELDAAEAEARELAAWPPLQRVLVDGDAARLNALVRAREHVRIVSLRGTSAGRIEPGAPRRRVGVFDHLGRELGTITVFAPLDGAMLRRLRTRTGLDAGVRLVHLAGGRIAASEDGLDGALALTGPRAASVHLAGDDFRGLAASTGEAAGRLGVLIPQAEIDEASRASSMRVLVVLCIALLFVASVAYLQGRGVVATIRQLVEATRGIASGRLGERVPVRGRDELALLARTFNEMAEQLEQRLDELENERRRLREATNRFGEALAASHDIDQLLRAIVESAVDATRAVGGVLVGPKGEVVEVGSVAAGDQRFELPLTVGQSNYGRLQLAAKSFSIQDVETASILVGHAVVALENARLHAIVERQALLDGLTGLANRRQAEEALAAEVQRAARFGGPLAVVLVDLDDFKAVNDRHGHASGDAVLRELARVLRENVREVDLCARWGGEEFLLVLPETDADGAARVAERMRAALAALPVQTPEGPSLRVTASFGVAASSSGEMTPGGLVAAADAALYAAKRSGKDAVVAAREPVELV